MKQRVTCKYKVIVNNKYKSNNLFQGAIEKSKTNSIEILETYEYRLI